ncbi:MAG: type I methionyl aminopeptidase [Verrucomicrobiae bacterium]|nr:type I methionyl aminopeptidase [Verrucomicrobiae bacterium]
MSKIPIKNAREIEAMRCSGAMAREILEEMVALCVPGVTTSDLDRAVAEKIQERGAKSAFLGYRGFPGNCCISLNEEVVHGMGTQRRVQYGDLVKLDIGIIWEGWIGDTATTVVVGVVAPEVQRMVDVTEEALNLGIAQAISGNCVDDISCAIESYVTRHGYSVVREFVGHGVGKKLHEEPQVPNYRQGGPKIKLKPGMTLAIEPMVNMGKAEIVVRSDGWTAAAVDGKPSAHFEHTVLITENKPEILTCSFRTASK